MTEKEKSPFRVLVAVIFGLLGAAYLVNPGAGVFEILPDNLPFVGNLDEATATLLVIGALRYLGLDLTKYFGKKELIKRDD
jgi:uncharacterized membrane protein YkvA (DUF1232 family)